MGIQKNMFFDAGSLGSMSVFKTSELPPASALLLALSERLRQRMPFGLLPNLGEGEPEFQSSCPNFRRGIMGFDVRRLAIAQSSRAQPDGEGDWESRTSRIVGLATL